MKKLVFLLIGLTWLNVASAGEFFYPSQNLTLDDGAFLGLESGLIMGQYRNFSLTSADLAGNDTSSLLNNYLDQNVYPAIGVSGHLIGHWKRFYLALSASVNYSRQVYQGKARVIQSPSPNIDLGHTVTAKTNGLGYDVAINPGLMISPSTALFAIVGVTRERRIIDADAHYIYQNGSSIDTGNLFFGQAYTQNGRMFGAGIRCKVTRQVNFYLKYLYKTFKDINLAGSNPIIGAEAGDTLRSTSHIRPNTQTILIGFDTQLGQQT